MYKYTPCIHESYPGEMISLWGGLEFRMKYHFFVGKGMGGCSLLGKSKLFGGKMNGPLEEQVRDMTVCDTVCLVSISSLLSWNESIFPGR